MIGGMVGRESSWLTAPGLFPSTVSRIERDVREPSIKMLCGSARSTRAPQIASLKRRAARASKTRVEPVQKARFTVQAVHAPFPHLDDLAHGSVLSSRSFNCRRA